MAMRLDLTPSPTLLIFHLAKPTFSGPGLLRTCPGWRPAGPARPSQTEAKNGKNIGNPGSPFAHGQFYPGKLFETAMRACFLQRNVCSLGYGVAIVQTPPLDKPNQPWPAGVLPEIAAGPKITPENLMIKELRRQLAPLS